MPGHLANSSRFFWSLGGLMVWAVGAWLLWEHYVLPAAPAFSALTPETANFGDLTLATVPIVTYVLLASGLLLVISIFHPLRRWEENGAIRWLIGGLILGLLVGLIGGLVSEFLEKFRPAKTARHPTGG